MGEKKVYYVGIFGKLGSLAGLFLLYIIIINSLVPMNFDSIDDVLLVLFVFFISLFMIFYFTYRIEICEDVFEIRYLWFVFNTINYNDIVRAKNTYFAVFFFPMHSIVYNRKGRETTFWSFRFMKYPEMFYEMKKRNPEFLITGSLADKVEKYRRLREKTEEAD